ncbi:plasmalemma vesicle associated protein b [Genypterus blacodes]|uniref:plasmalemma vesicle associated protein b n=1 Tax=Genypterus blacodes TaxID=154954 RepID=UPI003F7719DA
MYSSSYSRAKFGLEAGESLHKPRGKSCGYYLRLIFFFSSLIQSLIIVSLVLFLVYGQPEKNAEEKRVKELELNFNKLSENNVNLRKDKGDLGAQLGARTAEKAALVKEVEKLKTEANHTAHGFSQKIAMCETAKRLAITRSTPTFQCPTTPLQPPILVTSGEMKTLQSLNAQQRALINLIEANFTQTVQYMSHERDNILKDRNKHHQDAITLRRDNTVLQEQLDIYTRKCKEDFAQSLEGIQEVTRGFLSRINSLFPHQLTFHLTCDSQREQMEKIKTSCTNLSRDVENKFQMYLDNVGSKVALIQSHSSSLEVLNLHLNTDLKKCVSDGSSAANAASSTLQLAQETHDNQMETLLIEQRQLRAEKQLQVDRLALRESEAQTLKGKIQTLTAQANCKPGVPKPAGLQLNPAQNKQSVASWPGFGAPGIVRTPTGR